ncbi:MAG: diguanylate cyclase [Desulfobacteraceae bacterium]|nr:MAG: diguanylate cyclase [Desulfobacteraceae bacterium]
MEVSVQKEFTKLVQPLTAPERWFSRSGGRVMHNLVRATRNISNFAKTKIEIKISLGYLPLVLAVIFISITAMTNLKAVNVLNREIVENDMVLLDAANKMADHILSQESYGRRYTILKSPDMLALFHKHSREFKIQLRRVQTLPNPNGDTARNIQRLHEEFNHLYRGVLDGFDESPTDFVESDSDRIRIKLNELMGYIRQLEISAKADQQSKMIQSDSISRKTFRTTAVLLCFGILFGIGTAFYIARGILHSVQMLKIATREISQGRFDHVLEVNGQDELGDLAKDFSEMTRRLARLEEMSLDSNPLTRLPGGLTIENILEKRIEDRRQVAFCLLDLDNFKAFNDRYGYARGNEVIRTAAEIIKDAASEFGAEDDFVGHIGGDDFAVITRPEAYARICDQIIRKFDRTIPDFYDAEDRANRCILSKSRKGEPTRFPLMTVSIAVVVNDQRPELNPIQMGEIAAELKSKAKTMPGSVVVRDRRVGLKAEAVEDSCA